MRPELEEIRFLENYLNHHLNEQEHMEAEVRLLWDQEYEKRLVAQRIAYQALQQAGRQQLRRELRTIHARLFR
jgi:hypothetical protein